MSGDRGAKALAERLDEFGPYIVMLDRATRILGEHGVFVEDASQHSPGITWDDDTRRWPRLICFCGWDHKDHMDDGYFDHIGTQP